MANRCRSGEKEAFWRSHVESQAAGRVSIRAYCWGHGLSEPSFYAWRREIQKRDLAEHGGSNEPDVDLACRSQGAGPAARSTGRSRRRTSEIDQKAASSSAKRRLSTRSTGLAPDLARGLSRTGSQPRSGSAGLIALDIVCDATPLSTAAPLSTPTTTATLEIEFRSGVVIRLREEVSATVLQRVIVACEQSHRAAAKDAANVVAACREVRSC